MENVRLRAKDEDIHQVENRAINNKKQKSCSSPRKYLREYSEVTGIHGLRYLTEKRSRTEKIIWALFLVLSLIGCVYMISEIWYKFCNSPVVINFSSEFTPIYDIPFPAVTICSESKTSGEKFNLTEIHLKERNNETLTDKELKVLNSVSQLCEGDLIPSNETDYFNEDFYEFIDEVKPSVADTSDIFFQVYWMHESFMFDEVFVPVITDAGVCYSVNIFDRTEMFRSNTFQYKNFQRHGNYSEENFDGEIGFKKGSGPKTFPRRAFLSGANHPLQIFFIQSNSDIDYTCSLNPGFRFQVHSPWVQPKLLKKFAYVPFERAVVASIKPQVTKISDEVRKYAPSQRKCYMRHERPLKFYKIYSQSSCVSECVANFTLKACGCVSFYMPHDYGTPLCGPAKEDCVDEAETTATLKDLGERINEYVDDGSICDCKPTCTDLAYNLELSQAEWNYKKYFSIRNREMMTSKLENSRFSMLTIYFESDQFLALERNQLYGISDFISNFGGLLGLFTGFSLLTLVEIIYFLSLRVYCIFLKIIVVIQGKEYEVSAERNQEPKYPEGALLLKVNDPPGPQFFILHKLTVSNISYIWSFAFEQNKI